MSQYYWQETSECNYASYGAIANTSYSDLPERFLRNIPRYDYRDVELTHREYDLTGRFCQKVLRSIFHEMCNIERTGLKRVMPFRPQYEKLQELKEYYEKRAEQHSILLNM